MPKWVQPVIGGLEIAGGIAIDVLSHGSLAWLGNALIASGAGTLVSGIGTLLQKGPLQGIAGAQRNSVAAWNVIYGRARVGGTIIFIDEFDENNKYLDLIIVLACHPCAAVEKLYVDGAYVPIDPTTHCSIDRNQYKKEYYFGDSNGTGATDFLRQAGLVTVTLSHPVESYFHMADGDKVKIDHMPAPVDAQTLQGTFPITINPVNPNQFFYTAPGNDTHIVNAGHFTPVFSDYKSKIYMESLLGTQTLGTTFSGMTGGTTYDGDLGHSLVTNPSSQWNSNHSCVGHTLVHLRLHYNDQVWTNGIPQLAFVVKGKNDIYDPRTGTSGYSENAALCTADYLANQTWGYRLNYGTDIPNAQLIAAANICDESVSLAAGGSESRYTCNGTFPLSMSRGEILQNLLTSCGGRLTRANGKWVIWPAAWQGVAGSAIDLKAVSTAPISWTPKVKSRDLFNGVKGTYVAPVNNWQSSDFPRYAQDSIHGYTSDNNLAQDGGERRWKDAQLPFTNTSSAAQRLAKIDLLRGRYQGTGTFTMNMSGYKMTALDVWPVSFDYFSWSAKQFEVLQHRLTFDKVNVGGQDVVVWGTQVDVQETDASIYDWSATEELSPQGYRQSVLPSNRNLSVPTNLTLESDSNTALLQNNGLVRSRILATWVDPADGYFTNGGRIEVQYQHVGDPWTNSISVNPGVQFMYIDQVEPGEQYNVQIRAVNTAGVPSDWVQAGPITVSLHDTEPLGPNGGGEYPVYTDPIYPQAMFALRVDSVANDDGSVAASATASVVPPANTFSALIPAPIIDTAVTVNSTGGTIPGGQAVYLSLVAIDTNGDFTEDSDVLLVTIPAGTNTNSVVLTVNNYSAGMFQFQLRTGITPAALRYRRLLSAGATVTLTSLVSTTGDSYAGPDPLFDHLRIEYTKVLLAGSFGGKAGAISKITAISTSSGNHYTLTLSGAAFTSGALVGRVLSTIATVVTSNPVPLQDYTITANTSTTVTVVAPPAPFSWNGPGPSFSVGDQVIVRLSPTTYTGSTVGDSLLSMTTDEYATKVLRARFADGTHQSAFILGNSATTCTLETSLTATRGTPVMWWIEESSFSASAESQPPDRSNHGAAIDISVPIDNTEAFIAVMVRAVTPDGVPSEPDWSPIRDAYWPGVAGTGSGVPDPDYQSLTMDGSHNIGIDLPAGRPFYNFKLLITAALGDGGSPENTIATITAPTRTGGTISAGLSFGVYFGQDGTGNHPPPNLDTGAGGFTTDAAAKIAGISGKPNEWTYVQFTFHGTKFGLDVITPGIALT